MEEKHTEQTSFFDAAIQSIPDNEPNHKNIKIDSNNQITNENERYIQIARNFLKNTSCTELLRHCSKDDGDSKDRLVKIGRNVSSTVRMFRGQSSSSSDGDGDGDGKKGDDKGGDGGNSAASNKSKINDSLKLLTEECNDLAAFLQSFSSSSTDQKQQEQHQIPKVRFGKTNLQMSIITLGSMRFQQTWNRSSPPITSMENINSQCQSNLLQILRHAIHHVGINHIETAKGYGTSELQLGEALATLFRSNEVKREDLIIQTKGGVSVNMTKQELREQVLKSLKLLQLDYVDLYSVHGLNSHDCLDWLFNNQKNGNLMEVLMDLKGEGKIRHIGFSSHAFPDVIGKAIETDAFDYMNVHYHFIGSYWSMSNDGGNLSNIIKAYERDMGVFIISPYDKGGRLYAPSNKLRELTLPQAEPMAYASWWLWQHHHGLKEDQCKARPSIHTIVCGAARPSDLDQPVLAALRMKKDPDGVSVVWENIESRMQETMEKELGGGEDWVKHWHVNLPNVMETRFGTNVVGIMRLNNIIKGYGLLDYAKERYHSFEGRVWDKNKPKEDNIKSFGVEWGWAPGCGVEEGCDYGEDLSGLLSEEKRKKVLEALEFVHKWCGKGKKDDEPLVVPPVEWEISYDMRPWTAFPELPPEKTRLCLL